MREKIQDQYLQKFLSLISGKEIRLFWLAYLLINLYVALQIPCAQITPDEIVPLGLSANVAGNDWKNITSLYKNYYGYIQCILYVPLFWIIKDGIVLYKAILCMNALIISFIPVLAWKGLKKIYNADSKSVLCIVAVASLQPAYLNLSKRAWNETGVMILIWCVVYLLCCLIGEEEHRVGKSILMGVTLAAGYILHGRFLAVIVAVILTDLICRLLYKRKIINSVLCYAVFLFLLIIDKYVCRPAIFFVLWGNKDVILRNTMGETVERLFLDKFSLTSIHHIVRAFSGSFFYLLVASCGLIVIGLILLVKLLQKSIRCKKRENKPIVMEKIGIIGIFAFVGIFLAMGISALFFITEYSGSHEYYYIYGRYIEYFLGPVILITLVLIFEKKVSNFEFLVSIAIFTNSCLYTFLLEKNAVLEKVWVHLNVYTLQAFAPNYSLTQSEYNFIATIVINMLLFIILVCILRQGKFVLGSMFLCMIFFSVFMRTSANTLIKDSKDIYTNIEQSLLTLNEINERDSSLLEDYEIGVEFQYSTSLQVALPDGMFKVIENNQIIENEKILIFKEKIPKVERMDFLYQIEGFDSSVYIYGEGLAERLRKLDFNLIGQNVAIGECLLFNNTVEKRSYKMNHWYSFEDWGVWSEGNKSSIEFLLNEQPMEDVTCSMVLSSFYNEKKVEIFINGISQKIVTITPQPTTYEIEVSQDTFGDEKVIIEFSVLDSVFSPSSVMDSSDERYLGVGLQKINFLEKGK